MDTIKLVAVMAAWSNAKVDAGFYFLLQNIQVLSVMHSDTCGRANWSCLSAVCMEPRGWEKGGWKGVLGLRGQGSGRQCKKTGGGGRSESGGMKLAVTQSLQAG